MDLSLLDIRWLALLTAVVALRPLVPVRFYPMFGAAAGASLVGLASPITLASVGGIAVLWLWPIAALIRRARQRGGKEAARPWLVLGMVGLIALLVLFKVTRSFTLPWLSGGVYTRSVLELVGFSYFVFRAVNYLFIGYLVDLDDRSPFTLLFYLFFPATFTSGPIHRYADFHKQVGAPRRLDASTLVRGIYRITRGYFRKVCVGYVLYVGVERFLGGDELHVLGALALIALLYAYFFFDFAGYSDIAIGYGLLLGIVVPENFNRPFLATSITEFWRRWHMSLGDWFRDHVFIPLGGMRRSRLHASAIAFLVMVLVGVWHGMTWMFLAWGFWHGVMLFLEGAMGSKPMPPGARHGWRYCGRVAFTNIRAALPCIFFLPTTDEMFFVLKGLITW